MMDFIMIILTVWDNLVKIIWIVSIVTTIAMVAYYSVKLKWAHSEGKRIYKKAKAIIGNDVIDTTFEELD